jgi:hypothetical protein
METAGKVLLVAAAVLLVLGLGALLLARLGVDHLPGTIRWKPSGSTSVTIPLGLMIVLSIVGTIILNIIARR